MALKVCDAFGRYNWLVHNCKTFRDHFVSALKEHGKQRGPCSLRTVANSDLSATLNDMSVPYRIQFQFRSMNALSVTTSVDERDIIGADDAYSDAGTEDYEERHHQHDIDVDAESNAGTEDCEEEEGEGEDDCIGGV